VNAPAWVTGWVDWDGNGWFDTGETIINTAVPSGLSVLQFNVPSFYVTGTSVVARFRAYPGQVNPGAVPDGAFTGGEVEDYNWSFTPTAVDLSVLRAGQPGLRLPPYWTWIGLAGVFMAILVGFRQRAKR
jgi:hypothetical protein